MESKNTPFATYRLDSVRDGRRFPCIIEVASNDVPTQLIYKADSLELSAEHEWPFFALIDIRSQLERLGILLLCQGSRVNVYPSGMSAAGFYAYEMELHKQATKLVHILEHIKDGEKSATVEEQKNFWEQWLKSL